MTATPTPGDLSARLLAAADECAKDAPLLREAAAALSALPAAGGAVAWRNHDAAIDAKALATAQEIALMWGQDRSQFVSRIQVAVIDAMRWFDAATTPQPSAAEKVGCEGDDGLLRIHAESETCDVCAAVGAQGDGLRSALVRLLEAYDDSASEFEAAAAAQQARDALAAAPAAGKGVDDGWRSIVYAALRSIRYNANNGSQDRPQHQRLHLIGVEAERAIAALEAALTRQPVAGDGK